MEIYDEKIERKLDQLDGQRRNKSVTHRLNAEEFALFHRVKYKFQTKYNKPLRDLLRSEMVAVLRAMDISLNFPDDGSSKK